MAFDLDTTGIKPDNAITRERHTVTSVNAADYSFIIPVNAPFFSQSLKVYLEEGSNLTLLSEGVDYGLSLQFQSATLVIAKPVYGAISFYKDYSTAQILIDYQTLGGEWVLNQTQMSEVLANIIYNPRGLTWEEVANVPKLFPPAPHPWNFSNMVGLEGPTQSLNEIAQAIANRPSTPGANLNCTKDSIGLGKVENYPPASIQETIAGLKSDALVTPATLKATLQALGILDCSQALNKLSTHIQDKNNPHEVTKAQVLLGSVENLPVATAGDILAKRQVRKYLTLDLFLQYMQLYGCSGGKDESAFAPYGALAATYCAQNFTNMGVYHNGSGGTYEKVIELNAKDCGYKEPPKVQNPTRGSILDRFCDQLGDLWAYVADGDGNATTQLLQKHSPECNKTPTPQPQPQPPTPQPQPQPPTPQPQPQPGPKSVVYSTTHTTIREGTNETITVRLKGFTPNSSAILNGYIRHPKFNNGQKYNIQPLVNIPVQINANGEGTYTYQNPAVGIDNAFNMAQAQNETQVTFESWFEAEGVESNHVSRTFIRDTQTGMVHLTMNGGTDITVRIGDNVRVRGTFSRWKPNSNVPYYLKIQGPMDNREAGRGTFNINVDATGSGVQEYDTTLAIDGNVRGRHSYVYYATVGGKTVASNVVYVTFVNNNQAKAITYSTNTPTLRVGTLETQTVRLSGYPANSIAYITFWHRTVNWGPAETSLKNIPVQIDANGNGTYVYSTGQAVKQEDIDFLYDATGYSRTNSTMPWYSWIVDQNGARSNEITRTFVRSGSGGGGGAFGPRPSRPGGGGDFGPVGQFGP